MHLNPLVFDVWVFRRAPTGVEYLLLPISELKANRHFNGGRFWQIPWGVFQDDETVTAAGVALGNEVAPAIGAAAGVSGMSGILALARSYWASSTKQDRERIGGVMDAIGQAIASSESHPASSSAIGDRSGDPEIESETLGDAS